MPNNTIIPAHNRVVDKLAFGLTTLLMNPFVISIIIILPRCYLGIISRLTN